MNGRNGNRLRCKNTQTRTTGGTRVVKDGRVSKERTVDEHESGRHMQTWWMERYRELEAPRQAMTIGVRGNRLRQVLPFQGLMVRHQRFDVNRGP